jgi:hypothetical protein
VAETLPEMNKMFTDLAFRLRNWVTAGSVQRETLDA